MRATRKQSLIVLVAVAVLMVTLGGGIYYGTHGRSSPLLAASSTTEIASVDASDTTQNNPDNSSIDSSGKPIAESAKSGIHVDADVISQSAPAPDGYVQYRNEKYGFSFYHSPEGKITEYDEGGGAETVVLENFQKVRGMQVFIVPYSQSSISEQRFRMDVPSGVRTNVQDATLDGVQAVTFNSQDMTLGETREIWILKGGYLYEITTFSGVGQWFTPIIQSWRWL